MSGSPPQTGSYHGWPAVVLERGGLRAVLTPTVGGRLMSLSFAGVQLLYQEPTLLGQTVSLPQEEPLQAAKARVGFPLWGGDKTWIAPQEGWLMATPPPDLDTGPFDWRQDGEGVVMHSGVCRETGLVVSRRVSLPDEHTLVLEQTLIRHGPQTCPRGIWNVTQCQRPMTVLLPMAKDQLQPYAHEGDSVALHGQLVRDLPPALWRQCWELARLSPPPSPTPVCAVLCHEAAHFKYGGLAVPNDEGQSFALALRPHGGGLLVFSRTFSASLAQPYLHGASVEVYNAPKFNYLEVEAHAPFAPLAQGQSVHHRQTWRFHRLAGEHPLTKVI